MIAREGARRGCGWRDRAEGSVGFAPSGEMPIQREGCDSHLVLLHLPPHPSPSPRAHHLPHTLLAQVALVFPLGHPFWPPSWSCVNSRGGWEVGCLLEIFRTWGSSDKAAGMPGCPGPIADPDNPCFLRTAAVALCACSIHSGRGQGWKSTRTDNISSVVGLFSPTWSTSTGLHVSSM